MLSGAIGKPLERMRLTIAAGLVRLRVRPDHLTALGCLIMAAAGVLIALGRLRTGGALLIAAGACDILDGAVARVGNQKTAFGAFLDSSLDRVSDLAVLGGLAIRFAALDNLTYVALAILALGAGQIVSYTRARAECLIESCKVGFWERPERTVLIILGLLAGRLPLVLWILAILPWFTVLHRILYARWTMTDHVWSRHNPLVRAITWSPTRGSIGYDVVCVTIIAALFIAPVRLSDPVRQIARKGPATQEMGARR